MLSEKRLCNVQKSGVAQHNIPPGVILPNACGASSFVFQRAYLRTFAIPLPPNLKGGAVWFGEKQQERFQGTIEGIGRRSPGPICECGHCLNTRKHCDHQESRLPIRYLAGRACYVLPGKFLKLFLNPIKAGSSLADMDAMVRTHGMSGLRWMRICSVAGVIQAMGAHNDVLPAVMRS